MALEPVAETTADPNSFGFRPCRSTADAIEQCFTTLHRADRAQWILEADIRSCFDEISHEWLIANISNASKHGSGWSAASVEENLLSRRTESRKDQHNLLCGRFCDHGDKPRHAVRKGSSLVRKLSGRKRAYPLTRKDTNHTHQ
ncbi:group II intron-encoded reverse transcriptase [Escherichia coli]|nr:reverse transcriptase [Escherichia coli]GDR21995.1 reverse transcriptase [Escherichia coli]SQS20861.1 group II intron-encoded reverse transcriptase [Escherichia coli]SQZ87424.1 group II intron-encoded reverse transcriptase [Escherichia coli]